MAPNSNPERNNRKRGKASRPKSARPSPRIDGSQRYNPQRSRVTVIIPTYNRPDMAARAAQCALDQVGVDTEVVVVDDASPNVSEDELRDALPSEVRLHRVPENGGVSRARNAGLSLAEGDWITFLDDDDVIAPTKIRHQLDACVNTGRPWAISSVCVVDEDLVPIRIDRLTPQIGIARSLLAEYLLPAVMSNLFLEAETAGRIGGLDARYLHNADWDYVTRLALLSDPAFVPQPDVGYVLHSNNVSGVPRGKREDMELFEAKFEEDRVHLGADSSLVHSLRWIGMSSGRFGQRTAAREAYMEAYQLSGSPSDLIRWAAVNLPAYAKLMDSRQRRNPLAARASDLTWLADLRRETFVGSDLAVDRGSSVGASEAS